MMYRVIGLINNQRTFCSSSSTMWRYLSSNCMSGKSILENITVQMEFMKRRFLGHQATISQHQFDQSPTTSGTHADNTNMDSNACKDWFANRYQDTSFHAKDGLDPNDWLLVYRILDEKQRDRMEFSLYAVAFGAFATGCFIFAVCMMRKDENPFKVAPAFILGGIMAIIYATRLRRYGVIRMYANKLEQEEWERWRVYQLILPPNQRTLDSPERQFRIVWTDLFHRSNVYAYNSRQITDAVHRPKWLARALNGNFMVSGRPWAVHPEFFIEPPDYIFMRRA